MKVKNIFWGLFFILAATLIVINQMGLVTNFSFFKVAGGVILLAISVKGCLNRCFGAILFPLALIAMLFSKELAIESLTPWPILLVALLATIGLTLIFPNRKHTHFKSVVFGDEHCNDSGNFMSGSTCSDNDSNEFVTCNSRFSSVIKYINSDNFQRADLNARFGSIKVFFDNAVIAPGTQAVINIDASFSGIELFVPRSWKLVNNANTSFCGIDEKNHYSNENPTTVFLTGQASFCGVEITYI